MIRYSQVKAKRRSSEQVFECCHPFQTQSKDTKQPGPFNLSLANLEPSKDNQSHIEVGKSVLSMK